MYRYSLKLFFRPTLGGHAVFHYCGINKDIADSPKPVSDDVALKYKNTFVEHIFSLQMMCLF